MHAYLVPCKEVATGQGHTCQAGNLVAHRGPENYLVVYHHRLYEKYHEHGPGARPSGEAVSAQRLRKNYVACWLMTE